MRHANMLTRAALLAGVAALAACDDDDDRASANPPGATPTTQSVLALAGNTSETADPFPVNDGAFTFNDSSDITDPASINRP